MGVACGFARAPMPVDPARKLRRLVAMRIGVMREVGADEEEQAASALDLLKQIEPKMSEAEAVELVRDVMERGLPSK